MVSIPFEQGDVFRHETGVIIVKKTGLNPFRAGRCLSTMVFTITFNKQKISIPFEQGDVFRPKEENIMSLFDKSQSLSIRAMSFDGT